MTIDWKYCAIYRFNHLIQKKGLFCLYRKGSIHGDFNGDFCYPGHWQKQPLPMTLKNALTAFEEELAWRNCCSIILLDD
jgi:hypothetical protein